jgi:polyisoprenyl-phosphate glycosyltransferase
VIRFFFVRGPVLSLVLPIYNEEAVIPELHARLQQFLPRLGLETEVVFVDDGSRDRSLALLRGIAATEPRYRVLSFARNFGHQAAITAGLDHARGEAIVVMDADLQDPPEVVLEMVAKWREGFDVVYGKRRSREGETWLKLLTAKWFYRIFAAMIPIEVPLDTGDFRLMSRRIVTVLRELRETHRFVRGLVAWLGFKQTAVLYDRPARFAGETKFPLRKMLRFAIDGITSFSVLPLRFATYLGMLISIASVGVAIWAVLARFVFQVTVPGWTTVIVLVSLLAAVQLIMIGILGEYIGRIYEQVKKRPLYVVAERLNFAGEGATDDVPMDLKFPRAVSLPDASRADLRSRG